MSEKYKEYCMKFSNEEIRAYMVDYLSTCILRSCS